MVESVFKEYRVIGRINLNEGKTDRSGNPLSPCWRDHFVEGQNPNRIWRAQQDGGSDDWIVLEFDHLGCDQAKKVFAGSKAAAEAFADNCPPGGSPANSK